MITFSQLKELRLYRNMRVSFIKKQDRLRGTSIIVLSNDLQDIGKIANMKLLRGNSIKAAYIPRIVKVNMTKPVVINQNLLYKEIKQVAPTITKFSLNIKNYNDYNLIYSLYGDCSALSKLVAAPKKKMSILAEMINLAVKDLGSDYTEKIFMIPISIEIKDLQKKLGTIDSSSIITTFVEAIKYEPQIINYLSGINVIFIDPVREIFFKVDFTNLNRIKTLLLTLNKLNAGGELTPEEENEFFGHEKENSSENQEIVKANERAIKLTEIKKTIMNAVSINSNNSLSAKEANFSQLVSDKVEMAAETTDNSDEIINSVEESPEILAAARELSELKTAGNIDKTNDTRIQKLSANQDEVQINNKTFAEIAANVKSKEIVNYKVPTNNIYEETKISNLKDMDRSYNIAQNDKDFSAVISSFNNDPHIQLFIKDVQREDSSDEFNKKEKLTIKMADSTGKNHSFTIDVPIVVDDRFLYLNGGKKAINKQIIKLPITKLKPDAVELTSNYDKMILTRYGSNPNPNVQRLEKFLKGEDVLAYPKSKFSMELGNVGSVNNSFKNNLEYEAISSFLIELHCSDYHIFFDRNKALSEISKNGLDGFMSPNFEATIGYKDKSVIILNTETGSVYLRNNKNDSVVNLGDSVVKAISKIISEEIDPFVQKKLGSVQTGKKFTYSQLLVISKKMPVIVVLSYYAGLSTILNRYGIEYSFSEKRIRYEGDDALKYNMIEFKDGFLYYPSEPLRYSILLNGLSEMSTRDFNFAEFNEKDVYLNWFLDEYGSRNVSKGVENKLSLILDPITKEILREQGLPDDIVGALLYCNTLLESSSYKKQNDMSNYRIRGNEQLNGYLYYVMASAFKDYKDAVRSGKKNASMSVPKDVYIKTLLTSKTVENYSTLNPVLEAERLGATTYKGLGGINLDDAFGLEIRSYDDSMIGIFGINSPDSATVGVVRQLSYNPKILNNRGMLQGKEENDDVDSANMFTPAEMLSPFTSLHSDPPRQGMQVTQGKHQIPLLESDKPLFGTGVERTLPYLIGNDFVFKAKKNGKVSKIDPKTELMILDYDDGTNDVVDLSRASVPNSNGGFLITNQKTTNLKVGSKFKEGEVVAKNENFFKGEGDDLTYVTGKLSKVCIAGGSYTFEDSCLITEKLSKDMSAYITMSKEIYLGPNANVQSIVKKGDHIKTGDPLLVYENSYDDKEANMLLDRLGTEYKQAIQEMGTNVVKSKYTGEVVEVKIYFNKPFEELSPSLQKLIKSYNNEVIQKEKFIAANTKKDQNFHHLQFTPTKQVESALIKGKEVDGVLIEILVRHLDNMYIGDKLTASVALKSIIAEVVMDDETPYSETHKDEEISVIISPLSVVNRMTVDLFLQLYLNKVLIELKNKTVDIYKS